MQCGSTYFLINNEMKICIHLEIHFVVNIVKYVAFMPYVWVSHD